MKKNNSRSVQIKISLQLFIILLYPSILFSQEKDSLQLKNIPDTIIVTKDSGPSDTLIIKGYNRKKYIPDTLYLKNGDQITGKILSFEQGRLKIDGQGPGVVSIKWNKISSIAGGNRIFKVEDIHGILYIGRIEFSKDVGEIEIINKHRFGVMIENVIRIFPLEEEWYRGIKGSLGAGLNYAKSSNVLTVNANYNLYYIFSKWRFINDFSYVATKSANDAASIRIQTNLQALYALPNKWVLNEINSFARNDELGVKSRVSFGGGGGNSLVQTDWQRLLILTGFVENLERDIENNTVLANLEWPVSLQHTIYKFISPNLSSTISAASFVGITEKGRYRFNGSADLTWEFVTNFKLQLSFYYDYDNKNIVGKNTKEDYGEVISLLLDLK